MNLWENATPNDEYREGAIGAYTIRSSCDDNWAFDHVIHVACAHMCKRSVHLFPGKIVNFLFTGLSGTIVCVLSPSFANTVILHYCGNFAVASLHDKREAAKGKIEILHCTTPYCHTVFSEKHCCKICEMVQ